MAVRRVVLGVLLFSFLSGSELAWSQTRPARTEPEPQAAFGSVTGHVYLAGSNVPARFARVGLQPFDIKDPPAGSSERNSQPSFTVYQTDLEGGFRIDHVRPGVYYVVANYPGCLSPFALFTKEELQHPSAEVASRIAASVPAVDVRPSAAANITIRLRRGASLGGVVRFDDGTPFANTFVSLEKRGSDGKWSKPRATEAFASTDTEGHWVLDGLPPGDYRVETDLSVQERHQSALLGDNQSSWNNTVTSVPVYLGDTMRQRDAKIVTLEEGQAMEGQDITVPVSKMHTISGAVVDAKTGQSLNSGHVKLVYADDGKELGSVAIDSETRSYTLPFVPEGEYKLTIDDAHEGRFEQQGDPLDDPFHRNRKETIVRSYKPGELPVVVQGEMSTVNVSVEAKTGKPQ